MEKKENVKVDKHCSVLEEKNLVSEMSECDSRNSKYSDKYDCYLKVSKESRSSKSCVY